jgi:nucleoside-diphosphate-sugar epimerase
MNNLSYLNNKSILITGGTGFIGKNILDFLIDNEINYSRITLVTRNINKFTTSYKNLSRLTNLDFIETDISNLEHNQQSYDYVIHAATNVVEKTDSIILARDIVNGTLKVLEFAVKAKVQGFINFSSGAVYGKFDKLEPISENHSPQFNLVDFTSTYGRAKYYAEYLVGIYANEYQFKAVSLRCFAFAGKYLDMGHYAIGDFVAKAINNEDIVVNAGKHIYRSYLSASELVNWMFELLRHSVNNKITYDIYNVGSDKAISLPDLAHKVKHVLNSQSKISCPNYANENIMHYVPNIDKARTVGLKIVCGLEPLILGLADYA